MSNKTNTQDTPETEAESSPNFDLSAEYMAEIEPMILALHKRCDELGLPIIIAAAFVHIQDKNDEGRQHAEARLAAHLPAGRTPPMFRIAESVFRGRYDQAMGGILSALMNQDMRTTETADPQEVCNCPSCQAERATSDTIH